MPLAEIQNFPHEEAMVHSALMETSEISSSDCFGLIKGGSVSLPPSRCNSWRGRHSSSSSSSNGKHMSRRRYSAKLARTNSVSMPDCSLTSSDNACGTGLRTAHSSNVAGNCPVCMVRAFKTTPKGNIVNTGSFCKTPSSNSLRSSGSLNTSSHGYSSNAASPADTSAMDSHSRRGSEERDRTGSIGSGSGCEGGQSRIPADLPNIHVTPSYFRTLVLGSTGVGKTSLVHQFTKASEHQSNDDEESTWRSVGGHLVSVELDGRESTMEFIDSSDMELDLESCHVDAYIIVYSVSEPASFGQAASLLLHLRLDLGSDRPVYLVANKTDLVRQSRVASAEACRVASIHDCHFLETSTALNVNVDELLVGVLCSIQRQLTPLTIDLAETAPESRGRKNSGRRRSSHGKDRRGSSSSCGGGKRKSLGLLPDDAEFCSLAVPPNSFSCLTPGSPAFPNCRELRSASFSECSHQKSSHNALSAISNFIKQACRRESKRRDAHA